MSAQPIWFGSAEQPLFGWLHLPTRASVGVVLCPPIGNEGLAAERAFRRLGESLESAGVAVLRFDYRGTGDSAGSVEDIAEVSLWVEDVSVALAHLRSTGIARVALVGMRLGALFAGAVAAQQGDVDGLVLWDPCDSGRRYLREQRLLGATGAVATPQRSDDRVEILGVELSKTLADSLAELQLLEGDEELPPQVLVLLRPGGAVRPEVAARLAASTQWGTAVGQDRLFDVDVWHPFVAESTIEQIVEWAQQCLEGGADTPIVPRLPDAARSTVLLTAGEPTRGAAVVEHVVSIGPGGLFGIVSAPAQEAGTPGRSMLLLNLGLDHHIGPSRLWVDLAREWAAKGMRVLRVDLGGIGDSPARPGHADTIVFPANAIADASAAARFLAPDAPEQVLIVGVCSGGYHAAETAAALGSRAVVLVNPAVPAVRAVPSLDHEEVDARDVRRTVRKVGPVSRVLAANMRAVGLAHALIPKPGWWLLDKLHLYTYPARAFRPLVEGGTDTFVILGEAESGKFLVRGRSELRRLERSGRFHFHVHPELDHTLVRARSRHIVTERLREFLVLDPAGSPAATMAGRRDRDVELSGDSNRRVRSLPRGDGADSPLLENSVPGDGDARRGPAAAARAAWRPSEQAPFRR